MKLQYDVIGAFESGEKRHPSEVLGSLRISYSRFEGAPVADCIFFHDAILTVDYLPPFIDVVDETPTQQKEFSDHYRLNDYAAGRVDEFSKLVRSGNYRCQSASLDIEGFEKLSFINRAGGQFSVRLPEREE